jgi:hypothetical protein
MALTYKTREREREREREEIMCVGVGKQGKREGTRKEGKNRINKFKRCGFLLVAKCKGLVVSAKLRAQIVGQLKTGWGWERLRTESMKNTLPGVE